MADLPRPVIKAIPQSKDIFPCRDSLHEVEEHLKSQLPITTPNELTAALAMYHNTMLYEMGKES